MRDLPPRLRRQLLRLSVISTSITTAEAAGNMDHAVRLRSVAEVVRAELDAGTAEHQAQERAQAERAVLQASMPPIPEDASQHHPEIAPDDVPTPCGQESDHVPVPADIPGMPHLRDWSQRTPAELADQIARGLDRFARRSMRPSERAQVERILAGAAMALAGRMDAELERQAIRRGREHCWAGSIFPQVDHG